MLRNLCVFIAVVMLMYCPVQSDDMETPLTIEKTEALTEWDYEMVTWWSPFVYNGVLWLIYEEMTFDNKKIVKYKTYTGEWSSPQIVSDVGNFIAAVEDSGTLLFFWSTSEKGELEMIKDICFRTLAETWSQPSCADAEPYIGDQFVVKAPEGKIWLLWSRRGFWEYQVFQGDHWGEKQVLTTTEEYDKILKVFPWEDEVWIFYETETSDIYYRTVDNDGLSDPYPLMTEGYPYLYDVVQYGTALMVFLEVQGQETEQKTLVYTAYDKEWTPIQAVATPEEGFLSGGSAVTTSDGRIFVFWNGTEDLEVEPWEVDIFYRVYDGNWSHVYKLTDTPEVWEASMTAAEYNDELVIVWREKESLIVYASHAHAGEGGDIEEQGELEQVTPKEEPEEPEKKPSILFKVKKYVERYLSLIVVVGVLAALSGVYIVKKRISSKEEVKEVRLGERRKKRKPEKRKKGK